MKEKKKTHTNVCLCLCTLACVCIFGVFVSVAGARLFRLWVISSDPLGNVAFPLIVHVVGLYQSAVVPMLRRLKRRTEKSRKLVEKRVKIWGKSGKIERSEGIATCSFFAVLPLSTRLYPRWTVKIAGLFAWFFGLVFLVTLELGRWGMPWNDNLRCICRAGFLSYRDSEQWVLFVRGGSTRVPSYSPFGHTPAALESPPPDPKMG